MQAALLSIILLAAQAGQPPVPPRAVQQPQVPRPYVPPPVPRPYVPPPVPRPAFTRFTLEWSSTDAQWRVTERR
jgi:hypothetical protein